MATTLLETADYTIISLRVGMIIRRKRDTREVYIQPGDDTATMTANVDDWQGLPDSVRSAIVDGEVSNYFADTV